MRVSRNQFFGLGILVILIGLQFLMVKSVTFNQDTTRHLAIATKNPQAQINEVVIAAAGEDFGATHTQELSAPLGRLLLCIGAIAVLHSVAMTRPGT